MFKKYLQSAFFVVTLLQLAGCGGGNGTDAGSTQPAAVNGATQTVFTPSFTNDGVIVKSGVCATELGGDLVNCLYLDSVFEFHPGNHLRQIAEAA
jgi:hypothetical protein